MLNCFQTVGFTKTDTLHRASCCHWTFAFAKCSFINDAKPTICWRSLANACRWHSTSLIGGHFMLLHSSFKDTVCLLQIWVHAVLCPFYSRRTFNVKTCEELHVGVGRVSARLFAMFIDVYSYSQTAAFIFPIIFSSSVQIVIITFFMPSHRFVVLYKRLPIEIGQM